MCISNMIASKPHILIVDDEEDIIELLTYNLTREGYRVSNLNSGEGVVKFVEKSKPDLVLLDLMLPGIDGIEVCKKLRAKESITNTKIIMLTAKGEDIDVVTGLEVGADDYMAKPFSPKVLVARVRNLLRRQSESTIDDHKPVTLHDIHIDTGKRSVEIKGKALTLTYTEFQILLLLVEKPGWVFSRYQIVDAIRGQDYAVTERSVDVQIVGLRKKLGNHGKYIETVRGVGYKIKE